MLEEEILKRMDAAFRQDRERFFKIADTLHLQPKYREHLEELEAVKQAWRDAPEIDGYPNITHPLPLPDWFPKVSFASFFEKDIYLEEELAEDIEPTPEELETLS